MGYQHQWTIAVRGPSEKMKELQEWMEARKSDPSIQEVLYNKQRAKDVDEPDAAWVSSCDSGTIPINWDDEVTDLLEKAAELDLDMCYGRLGEEMEDYEFINGGGLYVTYERYLCPVDFSKEVTDASSEE